jgi:hypothetical protein
MNRPFRGSSSRSGAGATLAAALSALVVLGQVAVTSVDTSALAGTFDVVLSDTNEHVTGSFVAASCSSFDPNRTPVTTCQ